MQTFPARFVSLVLVCLGAAALLAQQPAGVRRNVVLFVADGLRHGSVSQDETPALWAVRTEGVHFANSHSLYPTLTTANASAIATGHGLGDTGDISNTIWPGFATFDTGAFHLVPGSPVPFLENDRVLADLDGHFDGNYLGEDTLLALARAAGYNTAAIGKVGPVAIQDAAAVAPVRGLFPPTPPTVIVDDATGSGQGLPLPSPLIERLRAEGIPPEAPTRSNGYGPSSRYNNGVSGDRSTPGTVMANLVQQQWFADVATRAILPQFSADSGKPFALVFWSRDPDATQHNTGDSLGALSPGINGASSRQGVRNADRSLQQLLAWLDAHPAVKANTDVVVTSDHGFATISRRELDSTRRPTASESARHDYVDASGRVDSVAGMLPPGFLAIDLALALQTNLFDPDQHVAGSRLYRKVRIGGDAATWEHPLIASGLLGSDIHQLDGSDALAIVAANGGTDLVYVPSRSADIVRRLVDRLLTLDYVSGLFVDDAYGPMAGTLPQSAIGLAGATRLPRPAIIVALKYFYLNPDDLQTAVQVSDTTLQEGQGMHGGFGRDSTFNNMAAIGPDFKRQFVDEAPVSNADLAPTLAHLMGLTASPKGSLRGRVLTEALRDSPAAAPSLLQILRSEPANGRQTIVVYQEFGGVRYMHSGCFTSASGANGPDACRR